MGKKASAADRKVLRQQRNAMFSDLNKGLTRAIQLSEAKAKKAQEEAEANIASTKRSLQSTIAVQAEFMPDNVFKLLNGKRQKIADNYLSLKAYAAVAKDKVEDYLAKGGKNRNLSSVGDLLTTVGALSKVKVKATKGLGFGAKKIPSIFSGKKIKVKGSVSKINGLVTEYMKVLSQVRNRFPLASVTTSWPSSRLPCRALVLLRSTRCRTAPATTCSSTVTPLVCRPSFVTSPPLRCTWPTTRRPLPSSLASSLTTKPLASLSVLLLPSGRVTKRWSRRENPSVLV